MAEESAHPDLSGKWTHERSENFDKFIEIYVTNFVKRKMMTSVSPTQTIHQKDDLFNITMSVAIMSVSEEFKVGEEFDAQEQNGSKSKGLAHWSEDALVIEYSPVDDTPKRTVSRQIQGGQLVMTMKVKDVEAKRYFKKAA